MRNLNGAMLLRFHKRSLIAVALLGVGFAPQIFAQSSGTDAIEESMDEVVVTATRARVIGIVGNQTAPKSRVSLSGEYLESQMSGQSVFQSLNQIPGVNFTNTDAYGTSGGNLRIRGFDGSRVSVTFDGVPLNDSGNYALFTNQMLDSELIDRVDVNLGTTDVDSPTASATGGTVAYRTRRPKDEFGGQGTMAVGEDSYIRGFLRVDTGKFGPLGTTAFFSASHQEYDKFKGPGKLEKTQFNAAFRQDFENENFITLAFHYNVNRNAFYRTTSAANYELFGRDYDNVPSCTRDTPTPLAIDNENASPVGNTPTLLSTDNLANPSSCGNYFGLRDNPSDTGNIRMQSLWHLGENLRLTFDPSWQYTMANGGGTTPLTETPVANSPDIRVLGASNAMGVDLNGDGDLLDNVRFYSPNTTNTKRWGATTSLIWDLNDDNRLRFAYTWDRARHRQTGMWGPVKDNGNPENVFAGREGDRVLAADGDIIRGRDRFSIAELSQFALEYRGQMLDNKLIATVGVRAPFFKRELNQYCYTPDGGSGSSGTIGAAGGTLCTSRAPNATLANGNVTFVTPMLPALPVQFIRPWSDEVKFDDILPNVGLSFQPWDKQQFYFSYAQGLSAPRTDNLYSVRRQPDGSIGNPLPNAETTKAFDLGWRFNGENTMASVALWQIDYTDRIVASFDPELGYSVDRNVGDVDLWGVEAQIGQRLGSALALSASAAYAKSELQEDFLFSVNPMGETLFLPYKGNELVETPNLTFALRADYEVNENFSIGLQGKYVDERFSTDLNDEVTPSYTTVDLDLDYKFVLSGNQSVELQFNITNLLDEDYYGTISSGIGGRGVQLQCINGTSGATVPCVNQLNQPLFGGVGFFSIGAPRTAMASFKFNF
jgi:iron complex outermembrane receptor protein